MHPRRAATEISSVDRPSWFTRIRAATKPLAEDRALQLAGRRVRQRVEVHDPLRALEARQSLAADVVDLRAQRLVVRGDRTTRGSALGAGRADRASIRRNDARDELRQAR